VGGVSYGVCRCVCLQVLLLRELYGEAEEPAGWVMAKGKHAVVVGGSGGVTPHNGAG
jgi:hypothetical protein